MSYAKNSRASKAFISLIWAIGLLVLLGEAVLLLLEGKASHNDLRALGITLVVTTIGVSFWRIVAKLTRERNAHHDAEVALAERTRTLDRLLQFSQTVARTDQPERIYGLLVEALRGELQLSAIKIVTAKGEAHGNAAVQVAWPAEAVTGQPLTWMRIPFEIAGQIKAVLEMALVEPEQWSEGRQELARTYVSTARSALTNLFFLLEAERQSVTDSLTRLYNRRSLDRLLAREVAMAERYGHPLSVVMIDLDRFKNINDTWGHSAGDQILRTFADCVKKTLRQTDLAFRIGGDEFVIALPQTPIHHAQIVMQKLRQAMAAIDFSGVIDRLEYHPTLSIGVTELNREAGVTTMSHLLTTADEALYKAKASNRDCMRTYKTARAA